MRTKTAILLFGLLFLMADCICAQDSLNISLVGSFNAIGQRRIGIHDSNAYFPSGFNGLTVYSLENPDEPELVGSIGFESSIENIDIDPQSNVAYVAAGTAGLRIIDISDPSNLIQLSTFMVNDNNICDVSVVENYAYIIDYYWGLRIVDITEPDSCYGVADYFFDTDAEDGLIGIDVVDNYAFVVSRSHGVIILDIADPLEPDMETTISTDTEALGIAFFDSVLYIGENDSTLKIYNISDITSPIYVNEYTLSTLRMERSDSWLYVAGWDGFHILDITNPIEPIEGGFYNNGSSFGSVASFNQYALVTASHQVFIFDCSATIGEPDIYLAQIYHDFGGVEIGTSEDWCPTIENSGTIDLVIDSIVTNSIFFPITPSNLTIEPGALDSVLVQFAPEAALPYSSQIHIYSNDPDEPLRIIYLEGEGTNTSTPERQADLPSAFSVEPIYPNPFNATATLRFSIPSAGPVEVSVLNLLGQQVAQLHHGIMDAGDHAVQWDATSAANGIYILRVQYEDRVVFLKAVLVK